MPMTFLGTHSHAVVQPKMVICRYYNTLERTAVRDAFTCAYAAENGQLSVLQWACANEFEWDTSTCSWAALN
jgi:hypothetical protein